MQIENSFIVTIRSTSERTETACVQSLLDEGVKRSQIHIINEAPFKKALETCFEVGLKAQTKWLLTFDADMVLIPGILSGFFDAAEDMPEENLQIQGQVLDKFFASVRRGGPRIYRVKYLNEAFEISKSLPDNIRPETNIISNMGKRGYPARYISTAISIHDFDQYYADIYRKSYAHSIKHLKKLPQILSKTTYIRETDADYKVFLKGIFDSLQSNAEITIDKRILKEETKKALNQIDVEEKKDSLDSINVREVLHDFSVSEYYLSFENMDFKDVPSKKSHIFLKNLKDKGVVKGLIYLFGITLSKTGDYFQRSMN